MAAPSMLSRLAQVLGLGPSTQRELGVHGTAVEGGGVSWEEKNDRLTSWQETQAAFDDMLIDPVIRGADQVIVNTCLSGSPRLRAADDTPEAAEVLAYCEQALGVAAWEGRGRIQGGLKAALRPLLSAYLRGVAVSEKVYEVSPDDGLAWLVRLAPRRQASIDTFEHDPATGHLIRVTQLQQTGQPPPVPMPRGRLVVVTYDEHLRLTQGMGVLRSAHMMRRVKKHTWGQIAVGVERWANATPKIRVNRTAARQVGGYDEQKLQAETQAAARNAAAYYSGEGKYLVGSDVVDYETFGEGAFDPTGPLAVIAEADKQVLLGMLVQFLLMGLNDVGSRSMGLVHQNVLQRACANLLDQVTQAVMEQAITPLVAANFGPGAVRKMPLADWVGLDFEPLMELLGQLPALVSTGLLERDRGLLNQIRQGLRVQARPGNEPVADAPGGAYSDPGAPGPGRPQGSDDA